MSRPTPTLRRLAELLTYGDPTVGIPHTTAHEALRGAGAGADEYRSAVLDLVEDQLAIADPALLERLDEIAERAELRMARITARSTGSGGGSIGEILGDLSHLPLVEGGEDGGEDIDVGIVDGGDGGAEDDPASEMEALRDQLRSTVPSAREQSESLDALRELGWKPCERAIRALRTMRSVALSSGRGRPIQRTVHRTGAHPSPTMTAYAQSRHNRHMARVQYLDGRPCREMDSGSVRIRLVLDTSGSMTLDKRIDTAIGIIGGYYLSLTPREREAVEVWGYSDTLVRLEIDQLASVHPSGGTQLSVLQPVLDEARSTDRWLVVTDGEIPDLSQVRSDRMAIVVVQAMSERERQSSDRRVVFSAHLSDEKFAREIRKLLR